MTETAERHVPPPRDADMHGAAKGGALANPKLSGEADRINEIDSLRAFAMTAVIAEHCKILPFGWMGVWLFFVVSGFVVTTSLMSRPTGGAAPLLKHFYVRRAARILPIYLAYVAVGFLVSGMAQGRLEWPAFASLALFYNNFQSAFDVGAFKAFPVGHLWTISVEMQFYLFFGFAFAFLPRRALITLLVGFLFLAPALRFIGGDWLQGAGFHPLQAAFAVYTFSPMHFDSFAAGALLALAREQWGGPRRARALLIGGVLAVIAYASVYALVNRSHGAVGLGIVRNVISGILFGDRRQVWLYSAVAMLSAGALATTVAGGARWWAPITRNGLLQAIGRASYGGYVYHPMCVVSIRWLLHKLISPATTMAGKLEFGGVLFALAFPVTVALSMLSYRYIERPIIRRVSRRLTPNLMSVAGSVERGRDLEQGGGALQRLARQPRP